MNRIILLVVTQFWITRKAMYDYDYYDNYFYDYPSSTWYDYRKWRRSKLKKRNSYILDGDECMDILEEYGKPKGKRKKYVSLFYNY